MDENNERSFARFSRRLSSILLGISAITLSQPWLLAQINSGSGAIQSAHGDSARPGPPRPTTFAADAEGDTGDRLFRTNAGQDLRSYGAKGDGKTDDTAAVNWALRDICSHGGTLRIPGLTFKIAGRLTMSGCSQPWRITGVDEKAVLTFQGQDIGLYVSNSDAPGTIENLTFDGESREAVYLDNDQSITFYRNTVRGGGAVDPSGGPEAGLWVQGGSDVTVEENIFTGNGPGHGAACRNSRGAPVPCPGGYDFVANFFYFARQTAGSTTERLRFLRNRIYGSNTTISMAAFNTPNSEIADNDIDQNNAYLNDTSAHGKQGQGYGINVYGNAHVGGSSHNWVSTVLSGDVVTTTMTSGSVIPYTVGQWVCANAKLGAAHDTDFSGCYKITEISGSGGSTPVFTWREIGANDSTAGIDIVNSVPRTIIAANHVANAAGACIYAQSMIDGHIDDNVVSNCAQMLPTTTIPMAGVTVSGGTRLTVNNNSINSVINLNRNRIPGQIYTPHGISAAMSYGCTYNGNTIAAFTGDGVLFEKGRMNTIEGNSVDGTSLGTAGISIASGAAVNLLTISHNTVERTSYAGISTGGNLPEGYGRGLIIADNIVSGNTSASPTFYCIQVVRGFVAANIYGNSCDGFGGTSVASGRTMREGIADDAEATQIIGNTVSDVSDYGYLEAGTDGQVSNNTGSNNNNAFAATNSKRARISSNNFGTYASMSGVGVVWENDTLHRGNQFTNGAKQGVCTLSSGTCTVSTPEIQNWSQVLLSRQSAGGRLGILSIGARTAGRSFVVDSSSSEDRSTVFWEIVH